MNDPETLARWLAATKEFVDRPGPYLRLDDEYDVWVVQDDGPHTEGPFAKAPSPLDLAKAILEFIQSP